MSTYQDLINFYHDCYELDNANFGIQDVLSTSVSNRLLLKTDDFITGSWPTAQINYAKGEKLFNAIQVYKREKEILCCFYFINFIVATPQGDKSVMTPLYYFKPYLFRKNNNYFCGSDHSVVRVNPFAVRMIAAHTGLSTNILANKIPCDFLTTDLKSDLSIFFSTHTSKINIDQHINGTYNTSIKSLKAFLKIKKLHLIPGAMIGMFKKGGASLGVLEELKTMAKSPYTSAPLNSILNNKKSRKKSTGNKNIIVPVNLNKAQQNILANYPMFTNSIVSGPPGTGKTLSIGAIVCDAVIKGKSVLIATKNEEPLDVIEQMLKEKFELSNIFLRGGSKSNRTKISKRLREIKKEVKNKKHDTLSITFLRNKIKVSQAKAATTKRKIEKSKNLTYQISELIDEAQDSFFKNIKLEISKFRKKGLALNDLIEEKHQTLASTNELIFEFMRERIYYFLSKYAWNRWSAFDEILETLTTRNKTKRAQKIADLDTGLLLKLFPIWGVTAPEVSNFLPLKKELFDLVIIDEASKSDIPSTLPLLYRAKNAIVIGDPKQLRHVSFLSVNSIKQLIKNYNLKNQPQFKLNYRSNSILDICIAGSEHADQFVQLKEHYRSYPEMIQFSNEQFYNNSLRAFQLPRKSSPTISLIEKRLKGEKGRNGVNKKEAYEVFVLVKSLILKQRGLKKEIAISIGVLSPFRAQVNFLQKEIIKNFSNEDIEKHQIVVGTPYAFQGDEKDIMILSFAMDENNLRGSHYLESEGVFNVAITRAKQQQIVLYSFNPKKLAASSILRNYLTYIKGNRNRINNHRPSRPKSRKVKEIYEWLQAIPRTNVIYNHNISVFLLDFLVIKGKRKIFVDLVGFEGETHAMLSNAKYDLLHRLDVEIFILTYRVWQEDKEEAKRDLWNFIHGRKKEKL